MILKLALIPLALVALSTPVATANSDVVSIPHNLASPAHIAQATEPFDWGQAVALKAKLLQDLDNRSSNEDALLAEFLIQYSQIRDAYNEHFYELPIYEDLTNLSYMPDEPYYNFFLYFNKLIDDSGFSLQTSEGMLYIESSADFLTDSIDQRLSRNTSMFLNLFADDIRESCCEDAGLLIEFDEVRARAYRWGILLNLNESDALDPFIRSKFNFYVSTSILGMPNTPTFDYETRAFDRDLFKDIERFVIDNPDSDAAQAFGTIIEMIRENGYILDENISEYIITQFAY